MSKKCFEYLKSLKVLSHIEVSNEFRAIAEEYGDCDKCPLADKCDKLFEEKLGRRKSYIVSKANENSKD